MQIIIAPEAPKYGGTMQSMDMNACKSHHRENKAFVPPFIRSALRNLGIDPEIFFYDLKISLNPDRGLTQAAIKVLLSSQVFLSLSDLKIVELAAMIRPEMLGVPGLALLKCKNVLEAVNLMVVLKRFSFGNMVRIESCGGYLQILLDDKHIGAPYYKNLALLELSLIVGLIRIMNADPRLVSSFTVPHAFGDARGRLESILKCQIVEKAKFFSIFVPIEYATEITETYDPFGLDILFRAAYDQLCQNQSSSLSTVECVKNIITLDLENGVATSIGRVSKALHMSVRALQRELFVGGTTYQKILDDVRKSFACREVLADNLSGKEIAALLGFSNTPSFYRAFRNWTGTNPSEFRIDKKETVMRLLEG